MFEIALLLEMILFCLTIIATVARLKLISLAAHFARRYGEEVKRTIKEKMNHGNMTAGRF